MPGVRPSLATFAVGSFWGAETIFRHRRGVISTQVGYMTPEAVAGEMLVEGEAVGACEVVRVTYACAYQALLDRFFGVVDLRRRKEHWRPPVATVFYHDAEQLRLAERMLRGAFSKVDDAVALALVPAGEFVPAPDDQQCYLEKNGGFATAQAFPDRPWLGPELPPVVLPNELPAEDNELSARFGAAFLGSCSPSYIRMAVLQDDERYRRVLDGIDAWMATQASGVQVDWVNILVVVNSATSEFRAATAASEYTCLTNLQPGNASVRWSEGDANGTAATAWYAEDGSVSAYYPSGPSGYGVSFDWRRSNLVPCVPPETPMADGRRRGGVPPLRLEIGCREGEAHELVWVDGHLRIGGDDATSREKVLGAFGGKRCPCATLSMLWNPYLFASDWSSVSGLTTAIDAGAVIPWLGVSEAIWDASFRANALDLLGETRLASLPVPVDGPVDLASQGIAGLQSITQLRFLVGSLPIPMRIRWLLSMMEWLSRPENRRAPLNDRQFRRWVSASVRHAVMEVLWDPLRCDPGIESAHVVITIGAIGCPTAIEARVVGEEAFIDVHVTYEWVTLVWARGLSVLDGHVVLDVQETADPSTIEVVGVCWSGVGGRARRLLQRKTTAMWDGSIWRLAP